MFRVRMLTNGTRFYFPTPYRKLKFVKMERCTVKKIIFENKKEKIPCVQRKDECN